MNAARKLVRRQRRLVHRVGRRLEQTKVAVPADVQSVVRRGDEERTDLDIEPVWAQVERLYGAGLHPAIALCVRHRGRVVLDRTIGHLDNQPGAVEPGAVATPDSLFSLFSASKILTAVVVHALIEDGVMDLDQRMVDVLPEMDRHGKDAIRLRHLLNHTAGIPNVPAGLDPEQALRTGKVDLALLADLVPTHAPGVDVAYHPITSWLLIAEMVERITGKDLRDQLESRILGPLGFDALTYGVAPDHVDRVAKHAYTGPKLPAVLDRIFERTIGAGTDLMELTNTPEFLTGVHPSANVIGTAREASRFMELLLRGGELDGVRVLQESTIQRALTDVTPRQLDSTFGLPMQYGLGTMMGGWFSLFGLGTSGSYGHLGLSNVVVYADPRRDISVAFLNTGKPVIAPGMLHWAATLQRIVLAARRAA